MKTLQTLTLAFTLALAAPAGALANCGRAADVDPASASLRAARDATLCLLNAERRHHHERALRLNRKLSLAAARHARDMVERGYFSHDAPSGQSFVQRIMSTDYVPPSASWFVGENLAWGSEERSTPRQIVRAWMASPGHRRNILAGSFREIGIAVVAGAPVAGVTQAATYATEFGVVHRR
jgi:uncharacterized protein YkwD